MLYIYNYVITSRAAMLSMLNKMFFCHQYSEEINLGNATMFNGNNNEGNIGKVYHRC